MIACTDTLEQTLSCVKVALNQERFTASECTEKCDGKYKCSKNETSYVKVAGHTTVQ